jgi:dihydroorotate dehydrogenase electron transfer subunit
MNKQQSATIIANEKLVENIYKIRLQLKQMPNIKAGQFLSIKVPGFTLRRPFGISHFDAKNKTIDFCFILRGEGTLALSKMKVDTEVDVLLPLGNGFFETDKKIMIIGGGVGVFPLLPVTKLNKNVFSFIGYNSKKDAVLVDDFIANSQKTFISTNDGSLGKTGFVTDLALKHIDEIKPDYIFACGPNAMFKTLQEKFSDKKTEIFVSLEQHMACGYGAGLCCGQKVLVNGVEDIVRVCCDGTVFNLKNVVL